MSDLTEKFEATVDFVQNGEGNAKPSNDLKLKLYALYKQATEGDVTGSKPGMMDFVGQAKYQARCAVKGLSREEAMQRYIDTVASVNAS
jgi:acyl-CoA-binding protein